MASSARIEELRKKFEENPRRYFAPLANEYRKAGDIEQAIAICREYLPQQPGHMSGHIVYGQALFEARQVEEAKTVFETALSLDPENLIALRHLGDLALLIGDSAGARLWYGRVLEADPRNEEIQAQLASIDQSVSGVPTPIASPSIPARAVAPTSPPAKPTPSTAPTVVVQAQAKQQPWAAKKTPPPTPVVPAPAQSSTVEVRPDASASHPTPPTPPAAHDAPAEIKLEELPPASRDTENSQDMTLNLEPISRSAPSDAAPTSTMKIDAPLSDASEPPPIDSFSLEGLETTSMGASSPKVESLSTAATVPVPVPEFLRTAAEPADAVAPASPPAASPPAVAPQAAVTEPAPPAASAPPAPSEPEAEMPLLDIGELPSAPAAESSTPQREVRSDTPVTNEPSAEASPPAPGSGPFVTETMAELYLGQGHRDEALKVYRALLEQRPGDALLAAKVAQLSGPIAHDPGFGAEEAKNETHSGPTIRELLTAIANRRPRPGVSAGAPRQNGGEPSLSSLAEATPTPAHENALSMAPPAAPEPPLVAPMHEHGASPSDTLSALFGNAQIAPADEGAATALAYAFMDLDGLESGGGSAERIEGAPARHAPNDLSLDSVFKSGEAPGPPAPSSFSFDQFFSQRATAEEPLQTGAPAAGPASRDDVAQFTQWLEGLKQR